MNRLLLLLLLLISSLSIYASPKDSITININDSLITVSRQIRNIAWITPSNATTINGWSIGWLVSESMDNRVVHINGLHTGISPITAFTFSQAVVLAPTMVFTNSEYRERIFNKSSLCHNPRRVNGITVNIAEVMESYQINGIHISALYNSVNRVNGISINGGAFDAGTINGISINGLGQVASTMNGIVISGLYNENYRVNGLQIGAYNNSYQTCGLQIGLFNKTKKLKGVQIGLWNKNGKLGLPFLNIGW